VKVEILIATEIWGRTAHVERLAEALCSSECTATIIDPYDGDDPKFLTEDEAYAEYLEHCGHEEFARRVSVALERATAPVCLVGFSAGAGAVWSAVCQTQTTFAQKAFCFYGSAIRDMAEHTPQVPVELIFPRHEPYFNVPDLVKRLETKEQVKCHVTPEGHGFINPLSAQYDQSAYDHWTHWLKGALADLDHA